MSGERTTESGILLPDTRSEGHPIVVMQLDKPGLTISVTGPEDDDLSSMAQRIADAQRCALAGEIIDPLLFAEPLYGDLIAIMPAAAMRVMYVTRGYMQRVDPLAHRNRQRIAIPAPPNSVSSH